VDIANCYNVNIIWDDEADVWIAICDDIPLALESDSYDVLIERVKIAAPEILALNAGLTSEEELFHRPSFRFISERLVTHG